MYRDRAGASSRSEMMSLAWRCITPFPRYFPAVFALGFMLMQACVLELLLVGEK